MEESKTKILLVEDETSMSNLISFKLKKEGFKIDVAGDGEEALNMYFDDNADYNVIILDLMLPVLDGLQVLSRIKKNNDKIPVLVLSAKSQEKNVIEGFKVGADDYLTKPFSPDELILRVKKLLEKSDDNG